MTSRATGASTGIEERPPAGDGVSFPGARGVRWVIGVVAVVVAYVIYRPALAGYFRSDDFDGIIAAGGLGNGSDFVASGTNTRPLTSAAIWVNHALGGLDPFGYYAVNFVVHLVTAVLVMVVARRLAGLWPLGPSNDKPRDGRVAVRWIGPVAGAVFLFGASHSEAVGWIAGRGDLLMTLFALVVVAIALDPSGRSDTVRQLLMTLAFVAALLSKESAITIPFVVLMIECVRTRRFGQALARTWMPFVVIVAFLPLRLWLGRNTVSGYQLGDLTVSPVTYVLKTLIMVIRSIVPAMPLELWFAGRLVVLALVGLSMLWIFWVRGNRSPERVATDVPTTVDPDGAPSPQPSAVVGFRNLVLFSFASAVIVVLPVAGLGVSLTRVAGERLVYLPSAFTSIALATVLVFIGTYFPRIAVGSGVVVVCLMCGFLTNSVGWAADAGDLSRRFTDATAVLPTDTDQVVINLPDSVHGALASRNALHPALVLVHGWDNPYSVENTFRTLETSNTSTAKAVRDETRHSTWRIEFSRGTTIDRRSLPIGPPDGEIAEQDLREAYADDVLITVIDSRTVELRIGSRIDPSDVWYFSGDRLHQLDQR